MNGIAPIIAASLLVLGAGLSAQQNVGLSIAGVISTSAATHCGFDCSNPSNTGQITARVGRPVDVRLFGDAGFPGVVAIGLGPALATCPAIVLPGFHNSLQILPPNLLVAVAVPSLAPGSRSCNAGGSTIAIPGLQIFAAAAGSTLTFQGLVFERGVPTFTRPVEMLVR